MNAIILGIFWLIYYAMVMTLSSEWIKNYFAPQLAVVAGAYRVLLPLFSGLNFALLFWFHILTPSKPIFRSVLSVQITGCVFILGSILVLLFSFSKIHFPFFGNTDSWIDQKWTSKGIYRFVRFPLFFAAILMSIAFVLIFPVWKNAVFMLVTILFIWIGALIRDRKRIELYGEEYLEYKNRVKMLIPYLM